MQALIARIALRYVAGALVAWGLLGHDVAYQIANDPDIALLLGMALGAVTEAVYVIARRKGQPT